MGKTGVSAQEEVLLLRKAERNLRILALPHLEDLARQVLAALEAQISSLEAARQSQARVSAPSSAAEAAAAASAPSP